jgi:hypothetical protein
MRGRHPDVDEDQVGTLLTDEALELVSVASLSDNFPIGAGADTGDSLAQEGIVVGDDQASVRHVASELTPPVSR